MRHLTDKYVGQALIRDLAGNPVAWVPGAQWRKFAAGLNALPPLQLMPEEDSEGDAA